MQKHGNLVDLVKSFPTNIFLQNFASIQKRTSPLKFSHLAEKSENGSISNLSTKHSADFELALVLDLPRLQVHEDRVVRLDVRIREPDRAAVVRRDVRVSARAELVRHHTAELVRGLVLVDLVYHEAALS